MKILTSVQILVFVVVVAVSMVAGQDASSPAAVPEQPVEGTNFCGATENCSCTVDITPHQIFCSGIGLKLMYEQTDFLATFDALNISANATLDLRFDENQIEYLPVFPPMPILFLILRHNNIRKIEARAFAELKSLDMLDLSYNDLTSDALNEGVFVGGWNESLGYFSLMLTHLNLSHNSIHSLNPNAFDHLTQLKTLDVSHNPLKVLSGTTSIAIASLRSLEYLGLAHTGVSEMHEGMLHDLLHLKALDLSGNLFVTVPKELSFTHALEVLTLDRNKFETLDKESFVGLESLLDLSLMHNEKLRSVELGTFEPLRNLSKLVLSFCKRLETLNDGAFFGMVDKHNITEWKLKEIYLNDNGLSQMDEALVPWDQVDYIDIQNNPFRCDCNLEWMMSELVPKIERIKPELGEGLNCAQPTAMKGKRLVDLMRDSGLFSRCRDSKDELFPQEISLTGSYRAAGITIMVIGVLLCVAGVSIVVFLVVKRRAIAKALVAHQEIRYERADSDDDGIGGIHPSTGKNRRNAF